MPDGVEAVQALGRLERREIHDKGFVRLRLLLAELFGRLLDFVPERVLGLDEYPLVLLFLLGNGDRRQEKHDQQDGYDLFHAALR